jgi:ABC-type uncharacterized transport system auxiliary subunit
MTNKKLCLMRLSFFALLAFLITLTGCYQPSPVSGKVNPPLEHQEKVIAKNFAIQQYVRVVSLQAQRTDSNLLEVKIALDNVHLFKKDFWCDIQVVFYDASKFELERTNWEPLFLPYGQVTYYKTCSLSNNASDYSILLSKPRKNQ